MGQFFLQMPSSASPLRVCLELGFVWTNLGPLRAIDLDIEKARSWSEDDFLRTIDGPKKARVLRALEIGEEEFAFAGVQFESVDMAEVSHPFVHHPLLPPALTVSQGIVRISC